MKKIAPVRLRFVYTEAADSERRVKLAYARIFELARRKMNLDTQSTLEYSGGNGKDGLVSDARGGSTTTKSQSNHRLPDVSQGKNSGNQIWQSLEDKQQVTYRVVEGEKSQIWLKRAD